MEKPFRLGITAIRSQEQPKNRTKSLIQLIKGEENRNTIVLGGKKVAHILICVVCEVTEGAGVRIPVHVLRWLTENDRLMHIAQVQPLDDSMDAILADVLSDNACYSD
jgi:hypothetical protein